MTFDTVPAARDLTDALQKSGALGDGRVRDVTVASDRNTIVSRIMRLHLTYDGPAPGAPASVILKTGLPDRIGPPWFGGRREIHFYTRIAPSLPVRIVPNCFDAHWNAETYAWHLLLEDMTDTHDIAAEPPLPPTQVQCEKIVAAWARFHAAWWNDPRLGTSIGVWPSAEGFKLFLQELEDKYKWFADRLGDALSPERRDLYRRFLDAAPRLLTRVGSRRNVTIIHGDAHVWNCFLPRDGGKDVRLFDWDSWRLSIPTNDLAYMMAVYWYPERRHRMERPLLDHYHAVLLAQGVGGYDRRALDDDYRLSVLLQMATPLWLAAGNFPNGIWWNNLERVMMAVDDWDCRELLQ